MTRDPHPPSSAPPDLHAWITLREWDTAQARVKGSAFRQFKALLPELIEGRDFLQLRQDTHADLIATLRLGNRLYSSTPHAVLLSPALAARMSTATGNEPYL